jgi:hypothetical protein
MNKLYRNPGFYWAWRRGIVLLALLLFAGCSQLTDAPPEDPNNSQEQSGQESPSGKTEDGDKSQGEEVIPGDKPATDEPSGEEPTPADKPATDEPSGEEPTPADKPATDEPSGEEPTPADKPAPEEPPGEESPSEDSPATEEPSGEEPSGEEPPPAAREGRAITRFVINGVSGVINETAKTIALTLPFGTDLKTLKPEIALSQGATVSPASGEAQNFANSLLMPKKYKVSAENGMQAEYKVTVQTAAQSSFTLALNKELSLGAAPVSLSKTGTASVSAPSGYEGYQWSMDGKPVGTDSRTITLRGEDYFIGSHYLGATAYQNGIPFYGELIVTITP